LCRLGRVGEMAGAAGRQPLACCGLGSPLAVLGKETATASGDKNGFKELALNERKEIKTVKAAAASFISVQNK